MSEIKSKIDLNTKDSQQKGLAWVFEKLLRQFKTGMQIVCMAPLYLLAAAILGLALVPGITLFRWVSDASANSHFILQNVGYGFSIAVGYFLYGISMVFLIPLVNSILVGKLKPWRGPYHSFESLKWFVHNGLTYLVRFTFLEFVTPSPLALLFYRMMGMKIGKGSIINSTWLSDPSLIRMGEKVTIGGSVTIVAHYGQGGLLVIAPVNIGSGCTIGLKASIMGGSEIGENAKILPHSVVLPKTVIPAGETWGGVPAQKVDIKKFYARAS